MPQLIENKQNGPVLIANFEPNEIATKSEEKTKIHTRKHCAGEAAQKVAIRTRLHCGDEPAQKVEIQTRPQCAGEAARHGGQAQKEGKLSRANESSRPLPRLDCLTSPAQFASSPGLLFFGGGGCGGAFAYDFEDGFGILRAVVVNLFAEMGDEGAGVLPSNTTMRTAGPCATAYGGGPSTGRSEVKNRTLQKPKS